MSHNFEVVRAVYDGTSGEKNPRVRMLGSVDGIVYPFSSSWAQIYAAYNAAGTSGVQQVLGPLMLNSWIVYRQIPAEPQQEIPKFFGEIPSAPAADANAGFVTLEIAEVGNWTA